MQRWWLNRRWRRLQRNAQAGPVKDYLSRGPLDVRVDVDDARFVALDLETTGLDPESDTIVAVGWVLLEAGRIRLETAASRLIRQSEPLPASSVTFHGLGDDRVAEGEPLEQVLSELLPLLAGRVVIAHHAALDLGFIAASCRRIWRSDLVLPSVDTLWVLGELARRRNRTQAVDALTLARAREQFALPSYPIHDALWDAIAAAELWLALRSELAPGGGLGLERFVRFLP